MSTLKWFTSMYLVGSRENHQMHTNGSHTDYTPQLKDLVNIFSVKIIELILIHYKVKD